MNSFMDKASNDSDSEVIGFGNLDKIAKRNGDVVAFDGDKIYQAIKKAGDVTGEYNDVEAKQLTIQVINILRHKFKNHTPTVEMIQDMVENALIASGHLKTARAYIVYREDRAKLRANEDIFVKVNSSVNEYLERADWRVNANANQGYSLGGLILNISGKIGCLMYIQKKLAMHTETVIIISMIWICWRDTVLVGRLKPYYMKV